MANCQKGCWSSHLSPMRVKHFSRHRNYMKHINSQISCSDQSINTVRNAIYIIDIYYVSHIRASGQHGFSSFHEISMQNFLSE